MIAGERAPHWNNLWLTLVWFQKAMFLKLRIYDCYNTFDQAYRCLISTFIATMLSQDRKYFEDRGTPIDWFSFPSTFFDNLARVGDGDIPQDQLCSIPAAEWVKGYYYTDPQYQTSVPMETLFGNRANRDVFFPRVSQFKFQIQNL